MQKCFDAWLGTESAAAVRVVRKAVSAVSDGLTAVCGLKRLCGGV
ncbi:hypothetical protein V6667_08025 [Neisseria leonii]|uniref:Transposase n=1 Tax=Neisseria leonii TaxID=2995413 RepID=A0A9X4E8A3_9NEIS|nr:hypothetical protein [Neisseria sp. 51.81]MDD9327398.1 hypothetical protein [Neisseria sp. 51.81]